MDNICMCTVVNFSYYNFDFCSAIACESSSGFIINIKTIKREEIYIDRTNNYCNSIRWNNVCDNLCL